jgi:hypothetical protein
LGLWDLKGAYNLLDEAAEHAARKRKAGFGTYFKS